MLEQLTEAQVAELAAIQVRAQTVPAGQWWWDIRPVAKSMELVAPGFGGETMLRANRWGFGGATIWMPSAEHEGILEGLEKDMVAFPGRKHHEWARTTQRPTAVFLANAKRDIDFLTGLVQQLLAAKGEEVASA